MDAGDTARPAAKVHTIVHFEIPASNPAKLAPFYERLFNWKFTRWEGPTEYWLINHEDSRSPEEAIGGLFKRNSPKEQYLNYVLVESIDESLAKATSLGAKVITPKQEIPNLGWFAVLSDPDGNTFALYQTH